MIRPSPPLDSDFKQLNGVIIAELRGWPPSPRIRL
jgi:hypothetical protein